MIAQLKFFIVFITEFIIYLHYGPHSHLMFSDDVSQDGGHPKPNGRTGS